MQISYKELADKAAISQSFATQILDGSRSPSLAIALRIYDATGLQFGILAGVNKETIEDLRPKAAA
jgi:transcriptional regulator with XRE-family HTH domain